MKKAILLTALIFSLCYTLYASAAEYDTIKVGLYYESTAKASVTVTSDSGLSYGVYENGVHTELGTIEGTSATIAVSGDNELSINGAEPINIASSNLSISPIDGTIRLDGTQYRGCILLTNASGGTMTVINALPTDYYLYGVIASEMPSGWHTEALKAQAICARGYAVSNYNKHASLGFNVCATTNCQVYKGVAAETASTIEAVDATEGEVLTHDGSIAQSLFYSSSGGHTANAENVWGSYISYLSGVEDPYESEDSPRHTWTATLSLSQIEAALSERDINIGSVTELIPSTDETGRVYELTVKGTDGDHTFTRQNTYIPFSSYGVISQKYSISPLNVSTSALYALTSGRKQEISGYNVISSGGVKSTVTSGFTMLSSSGRSIHQSGKITGYTFNGGGWGHGVGMSQYGAKGMAENGFTYEEILDHYFPGTELGSMYGE